MTEPKVWSSPGALGATIHQTRTDRWARCGARVVGPMRLRPPIEISCADCQNTLATAPRFEVELEAYLRPAQESVYSDPAVREAVRQAVTESRRS